jgi:hypothetical protein
MKLLVASCFNDLSDRIDASLCVAGLAAESLCVRIVVAEHPQVKSNY